jgi:tungstate transport system ATP-binding protein
MEDHSSFHHLPPFAPHLRKVCFAGKDIEYADKGSLRKKMTLILQSSLLFNTTVERNIAYGLKIRGIYGKARKKG